MNNNSGPSIWDVAGNVETLKSMWADGATGTEIAMAIPGASRSSVIGKARRLKLQQRQARVAVRRPRPPHESAIRKKARHTPVKREAPPAVEPTGIEVIVDDIPVIPLLELTEHTCKWPVGDPWDPGFGFCGAPSMEAKPYCEFHSRRAYPAL